MADASCGSGLRDRPHFSDGDLRASASPWPCRRQRQRQAASNYAVLLARLSATEEQLASQQMEYTQHLYSQRETISNLLLRLQMLEKVFIFMDWQKVSSLVEHCLTHSPCDTATGSLLEQRQSLGASDTSTSSLPPSLRQPEVEASPERDGNNVAKKLDFARMDIDKDQQQFEIDGSSTGENKDVENMDTEENEEDDDEEEDNEKEDEEDAHCFVNDDSHKEVHRGDGNKAPTAVLPSDSGSCNEALKSRLPAPDYREFLQRRWPDSPGMRCAVVHLWRYGPGATLAQFDLNKIAQEGHMKDVEELRDAFRIALANDPPYGAWHETSGHGKPARQAARIG